MENVRVLFSNGKELEVKKGSVLSLSMEEAGIKKDFPCGGMGKCGQCKTEIALLTAGGKEEVFSVLACSYKVDSDIWVDVTGCEQVVNPLILTSGTDSAKHIAPEITKVFIPGNKDYSKAGSYWGKLPEDVIDLVAERGPSLVTLQQYAMLNGLRKENGFTAVLGKHRIIGFERGDTTESCYGIAIDIGTTTVVVYLVDLLNGREVAVGADLNGQRIYGADVISRISTASRDKENLSRLQSEVIGTINGIVEHLTLQTGVRSEEIYYVTIAGNTCMHHLLLGLDPSGLGRAPFLPVFQNGLELKASELGLEINREADVWVFPVIAGFVGGDTVAAVIATDLHHAQGITLLIDIGTNGEMVINARGRMVACSAAAGPALEGAQIECGMRAEEGAIKKVRLWPEVDFEIVGSGSVKGICGSGLIDLLAEMIRLNLVNYRGKLAKPEQFKGPEYLRRRIIFDDSGCRFVIVDANDNNGREIYLSQKDISQIQLAKGAIHASLELLVNSVGMDRDKVGEVLVAGGFGNFMDIQNAISIGLLPRWAKGRIKLVGNAAGEGAKIALLSREKRAEAEGINKEVSFLELAGTPQFQEAFIKGMLFEQHITEGD